MNAGRCIKLGEGRWLQDNRMQDEVGSITIRDVCGGEPGIGRLLRAQKVRSVNWYSLCYPEHSFLLSRPRIPWRRTKACQQLPGHCRSDRSSLERKRNYEWTGHCIGHPTQHEVAEPAKHRQAREAFGPYKEPSNSSPDGVRRLCHSAPLCPASTIITRC